MQVYPMPWEVLANIVGIKLPELDSDSLKTT